MIEYISKCIISRIVGFFGLINNNFIMLSEAGRQYERSKRVKPLEKAQRQRVYKSFSVKVDKQHGVSKFSPFNTISRDSRTSYLLRVTHEPNTHTIYEPKYSLTLPLDRRSTIDRASFKRIIGEVKDQDPSVDISEFDKKCLKSHTKPQHRPLTVSETHNWRKTFEHFDFSKQQESKRLSMPQKLTMQESTREDFMHSLQTITESNFNNFNRFNFHPNPNKSHAFSSDSPHKYLKEVETREKSPQYDIQACNESFAHKSMPKTKGQKRFYLYREKIATRKDRADQHWHTILQYNPSIKDRLANTLDFEQRTDRRDNQVHSKYPIRLSLTRPLRVRE